VKVSIYKS